MRFPIQRGARGFSLVELLVVIAIVALMVSALLPVLGSARAHARTIACAAGQRQLGVCIGIYANDYRFQVPLGWGADPDVTFYYASIIESRVGNYLYHNNAPIGLGILFERSYFSDPHLLYCAGVSSPTAEGGYQWSSKGWNPTGGLARTNPSPISSYYYRYVDGMPVPKKGYIYFTGDPSSSSNIDNYDAQLDLVANYSALWCSCKNGMYHPSGYNVLSYGGAVRFVGKEQWPLGFPRNVWWDYTDCWGNMGDGLGYSAYPDFEFYDVADRLWK